MVPLQMVPMKIRFLIAAALGLSVSPATAAPWVRGFVVDNYEPAFYYGGRSGTEEPGPDCPKGTIPILDYKTVLKTSWRTHDMDLFNRFLHFRRKTFMVDMQMRKCFA